MGLFAAARAWSMRRRRRSRTPRPGAPRRSSPRERETIGFFITGHPLDRYEQDLKKFTNVHDRHAAHEGAELPRGRATAPGRDGRPRVRLGGVIHTVKLRNSKKGRALRHVPCSRTRRAWSRSIDVAGHLP